jgi:DNA-binding PadR family transcriptional regulator
MGVLVDQEQLLRNLFLGFVRIHILHHCSHRNWYGQELMEELLTHGYRFSYGTLYPVIHAMEKSGWLKRTEVLSDGRWRKYYGTTLEGRRVLADARAKVGELSAELEEEYDE